MKLEKIREMTDVELNGELKKMKNELFNLRFQHVTGQLENPMKMKDVKRNIARVKTVIREKELEEEMETAEVTIEKKAVEKKADKKEDKKAKKETKSADEAKEKEADKKEEDTKEATEESKA